MILLYLEGSGSKFHSVNTKTSQFSSFFGFQELRKKRVNTKTSKFPLFWIPGVEKKHVYIYIYVWIYVNYVQPFPRILWVAQLPMGFHLAPKHQWMHAMQCFPTKHLFCVLFQLSISVRQWICIYIYMYIYIWMSIETLFKEDIVFRAPLHFHILPFILVYANDSKFLYFQMHLTYIYIYILIYYIISSSSPKI